MSQSAAFIELGRGPLLLAVVLGLATNANTDDRRAAEPTPEEAGHALVLELGPAGDWSPRERLHLGGTFALEVTAIEHWLELECGLTVLHADGGAELTFDVLFKRPWRVSSQIEFMVGVGPQIVRRGGQRGGTFGGLAAVADLMVWPRKNVGWYVEPGYEVTFRRGDRQSALGIAAGLLIGR
ncbi:MAG TPA: hypothetical protein VN375_06750 [Vicinamibacteria bacterium]|jgi:hypothetical protein|nr:hypothetical protein [Vicinamibacteria bacterium]